MKRLSFIKLIGIEHNPSSHTEKLVSGIGGFLAIYFIYHISYRILGDSACLILTSMGASAVLLFAVPHSPLSQPWPLFGGNLLSAFTGVSCAWLIPDTFIAAAAAVGLSVMVMYYLKCIHPPGGATALSAVIGGPAVHALGFQYIIVPVLLNVLIIFSVAVLFNFLFKWRRYPASLTSLISAKYPETAAKPDKLSHDGIKYALQQLDSFIDISEDDLNRIYQLASDFDREQTN